MANLFDRAGMSTATSGTGALTLGTALGAVAPNLAGFLSFANAGVQDQNVVSYLILDVNGGWETGWGAYGASGTTLTRNVARSSSSNSAISLSGNAQVFITARAEDLATVEALASANIIVNGAMDVSQERGTNANALTNGATSYVVDGWQPFLSTVGALALSAQQVAPPGSPPFGTSFKNCVQLKATTGQASLGANDHTLLYQAIEGNRFARLSFGNPNAMPVTVGFWVYATTAGTMAVILANQTGARTYVHNVAINNATTWEWKTVTIPGDTTGTWPSDNTAAGFLEFGLGGGSTFQTTADTWSAGNFQATSSTTNFFATTNNVVCITGVVMLPGAHQLSQEQAPLLTRPYDVELRLCQRYYELSGPGIIRANGTASLQFYWQPWSVTKRAAPTIGVFTAPTYTNGSAFAVFNGSTTGFEANFSASGTAGFANGWVVSGDARM